MVLRMRSKLYRMYQKNVNHFLLRIFLVTINPNLLKLVYSKYILYTFT